MKDLVNATTTFGDYVNYLNEVLKENPNYQDLPVFYENESSGGVDIMLGGFRAVRVNENLLNSDSDNVSFVDVELEHDDKELDLVIGLLD